MEHEESFSQHLNAQRSYPHPRATNSHSSAYASTRQPSSTDPAQQHPQNADMARRPSTQGQKPAITPSHQPAVHQDSQRHHHKQSSSKQPAMPVTAGQRHQQQFPYLSTHASLQQASFATPPQNARSPALQPSAEPPAAAVHRASIKVESAAERSPKRRRSDDGHAVPVWNSPPPGQHVKQEPHSQANTSSDHLKQISRDLEYPRLSSATCPDSPLINQQDLLLGLSDEYISAAYSMSAALSQAETSAEAMDQYQSLLSNGMGCLDSVLKLHRFSDVRKEARVRLRLATLMYEETENDDEPAEILAKGISVCERARLVDLKYSMHHLLARLWHKSGKTKAASNAVDKLVTEVEKLRLEHWTYAFRFLRVSFGLQSPGTPAETIALTRNLTALHATAAKNNRIPVQIVSCTLEALVHLGARHPDSVDLAERALASVRTHQFTAEMTAMPQIRAFVDCIDLACSLLRFNRQVANAKMKSMQGGLDQSTKDQRWHDDGAFCLPVGKHRGVDIETETGGIFRSGPDGDINLTFSWLTMNQIYGLAFLINGLALVDSNPANESKAEPFLVKALELAKRPTMAVQQSQSAASTRWRTSVSLRMVTRLYVAFAFSAKSDWDRALLALDAYKTKDIVELDCEAYKSTATLAIYLEALCKQGLGDVQGALRLYQSTPLRTDLETGDKGDAGVVEPLRILAALNSIEILRLFGRNAEADRLLSHTKRHCIITINSNGNEHGSKALESAFFLLTSVASQRATGTLIIDTKQLLNRSVKAAQSIVNNQLLCVIMNVMTDSFFKNIVGQQAEQSARAGSGLAQKIKNPLWSAVANQMYGDFCQRSGRLNEAAQLHAESQRNMQEIHPKLLDALTSDDLGTP